MFFTLIWPRAQHHLMKNIEKLPIRYQSSSGKELSLGKLYTINCGYETKTQRNI